MGAEEQQVLLLPLAGRPVLAWSLEAGPGLPCHHAGIRELWANRLNQKAVEALIQNKRQRTRPCRWIVGGAAARRSVRLGLRGLARRSAGVLIHDGARCLGGSGKLNRPLRGSVAAGEP